MGIFGNLANAFGGDAFARAQALANGDYGAVAQMAARQQQLRAQQAEAQREQEARDNQIWGAKERGLPLDLISSLSPSDLSQVGRQRAELQRFDAGGGSYFDPLANGGQGGWTIAPSEREIGGDLVRTNSRGEGDVVYRGSRITPVQQGGSAIISDAQGRSSYLVGGPPGAPNAQFPSFGPTRPITPAQAVQQAGVPEAPGYFGGMIEAAPPPQTADARPANTEAPAFNADPAALAAAPPVATIRGIQFSPPLANMPRIGSRSPTSNSRAAQLRRDARTAIGRGANRNSVRARLRSMGVSDRGL